MHSGSGAVIIMVKNTTIVIEQARVLINIWRASTGWVQPHAGRLGAVSLYDFDFDMETPCMI